MTDAGITVTDTMTAPIGELTLEASTALRARERLGGSAGEVM